MKNPAGFVYSFKVKCPCVKIPNLKISDIKNPIARSTNMTNVLILKSGKIRAHSENVQLWKCFEERI